MSVISCSYRTKVVRQPEINSSTAARTAMELYDTNADGIIQGEEFEYALGLKAALPRLDTNGDGGVSADEIAQRVEAWKAMRTALASVRCQVTLDGRPISGAQVIFEPEGFLGEEIKPARGTTNQFGDAAPSVAPEDKPDPTLPGGVYFGLYKVRISKQVNGRETIPARYNNETILGQEVAYDVPAIANNNMAFALESGE